MHDRRVDSTSNQPRGVLQPDKLTLHQKTSLPPISFPLKPSQPSPEKRCASYSRCWFHWGLISNGLRAGGSEPSEKRDYGFMQQRTIEDYDGHTWEIFFGYEPNARGSLTHLWLHFPQIQSYTLWNRLLLSWFSHLALSVSALHNQRGILLSCRRLFSAVTISSTTVKCSK